MRESGPSTSTTICTNAHQTSPLSKPALPAFHHVQLLSPDAAARYSATQQTFETELERVRSWYGGYVTGYVLMPERVHLLLSEPERSKLSGTIQMLNQIASQKLRPKHLPHFWQAAIAITIFREDGSETHREAALHTSQSGRARTGGEARGLEMEQASFTVQRGMEGITESESQWTRGGENEWVPCSWPAHPPAKNGRKGGATSAGGLTRKGWASRRDIQATKNPPAGPGGLSNGSQVMRGLRLPLESPSGP